MRVYINWDTQEVVGPEQATGVIEKKVPRIL